MNLNITHRLIITDIYMPKIYIYVITKSAEKLQGIKIKIKNKIKIIYTSYKM